MTKILIVLLMLLILFNLATGLVYLIKDQGHSQRTVKALSWRIGLSLVLFVLLIVGFVSGVLAPHDL